jgi:hypothetical protein
MNDIFIVIPVVDKSIQDFEVLVNQLSGNYTPEGRTDVIIGEDGEEIVKVIPNPYAELPSPDFSNKIVLVSHSELDSYDNLTKIVVGGELNLSKLWNAGIEYVQENGGTHAVILNGVSSINPHVFSEAAEEFDTPVINISDGGCFIVKPDVRANEMFRFWFGDLDLFNKNETSNYRNSFIDIFQDNNIEIDESLQSIVDTDQSNYSEK